MILTNAKDELLSAIGNDGTKIEAFQITYKGYEETEYYYDNQVGLAMDDMRNNDAHESITHHNLAIYPLDRIDITYYKRSTSTSLANAL